MTRQRPKEGAVRESMREREAGERQTEERPAVSGAQAEDEPRAETAGAEASAEPDGQPGPAADEQAEEQREPAEPEEPLARAERERDDYLARAQRTQADFENYRKRAARELAAAGERARAGLVRELLPVVDNLERALASAGDDEQHLAEGVRLVHSELLGLLQRNGIEAFDPTGERFDPTVHEALSTRPSDHADAGVVLDVAEKGYMANGNVLRPARVVVSA